MSTKNLLAFDLGASGGRGLLGSFDGSRLSLTEVHRFENNPVTLHGTFYWDFLGLMHEIKQGIAKAQNSGGFETMGFDTWGVDFGLLDKRGDLLQNPVHYRDGRTAGMVDQVCRQVSLEELYKATGNQIMEINTLFQLYSLKLRRPELLEQAGCALLTPDLLGYFLTGERTSEYAIASTTQMLDPHTRGWNTRLLERLGLPSGLFPPVTGSGRMLGELTPALQEELGAKGARVVSITGHDTACAVAATPAAEEDFIYISCGTWSLFGTELPGPLVDAKSLRHNITNEGGYGGTIRFLKNIIGLWLIQETRRQYRREGRQYGYNDLEKFALASPPFACFIDPDDPAFVAPGNLPRRMAEYCRRTGQTPPETVGAVMRCIYESIALKYRWAFDQIKDCTGKSYRHIHMLGGGTKDNLLCRMAASATGLPVVAGPIEATALGNLTVQLLAQGELADLWQARRMIADSTDTITYEPTYTGEWEEAYGRFLTIIES